MQSENSRSYSDQERLDRLLKAFEAAFGHSAEVVIRVPGRVNLIGEHIDYCGYAVLPMAIEQDVLVAASHAKDSSFAVRLRNASGDKYAPFNLAAAEAAGGIPVRAGDVMWHNYFLCGVKGICEESEASVSGLDCVLDGIIPPSAGLSSSSAVVVSAAMCTAWALGLGFEKSALADLCARAERFIGTQGGGMDQAIEILASKGMAKLIEFNPLTTFDVRLPAEAVFVVANSLAESNKAAGAEFNTRVVECRLATKVLAKTSGLADWEKLSKLCELQKALGLTTAEAAKLVQDKLHLKPYSKEEICIELGVSEEDLNARFLSENTRSVGEFKLRQRALHVFSEADRVYSFRNVCADSSAGDSNAILAKLGELMFDSHNSCSKMYECSHPDLDKLVETAKKHGALGARLTGAGWGGCIVALVDVKHADSFLVGLKQDYYSKLPAAAARNLDEVVFRSQPGGGATVYTVKC